MRKILPLLFLLLSSPVMAADMPRETLQITSADGGEHQFNVEIARTPQELEDGLMFRTYLPEDSGMLFLLGGEKQVAFWMKNTLIPLDMVFITKEGAVAHVHSNAKPEDLTPIPSGEPVVAVLELNGGRAGILGIGQGDKVISPSLAMAESGGLSRPDLVEP